MKETVLITGASGFLGGYVAETCVADGFNVIGIDRHPPARPDMWLSFHQGSLEDISFQQIAPYETLRACFHLAGRASVQRSMERPWEDFNSLVPGTARLLESLGHYHRQCHFILFSSAAIYGEPKSLPVREDLIPRPISPYGAHKLTAEALATSYASIYGFPCSVLRIFSAYGAGLRKQVFWDTMGKYEAAAAHQAPTIHLGGTGEETRDYIHATDVARAALLVAQHPVTGSTPIYNVANGEEVSLRTAVHTLLAGADRVRAAFSGEARKGDPSRWVADIGKLRALGFAASVSLGDGLREYREWYLARR